MRGDGESLLVDCGVRYREGVVAHASEGRGLIATEYELLVEHVAFLFDAIHLEPRGETADY
jgi:hypothetical protein